MEGTGPGMAMLGSYGARSGLGGGGMKDLEGTPAKLLEGPATAPRPIEPCPIDTTPPMDGPPADGPSLEAACDGGPTGKLAAKASRA